jgi:hypothetical protein
MFLRGLTASARTSRLLGLAATLGCGALLAPPAHAAAVPAKATRLTVTSDNRPTRAQFRKPGQVLWYKVALTKGHDYTIYGQAVDASGNVLALYSPKGKQLLSVKVFATGGFFNGAEFHAPVTGTYYLKLTENPSQVTDVFLGVTFDCRTGPGTRCALKVGGAPSGFFTFFGDEDWRRADLQAGKKYTVTLTTSLTALVAVLDPQGKQLGRCEALGGFPATPCQVGFRASEAGTYYVRTFQEDEDSHDYKVSLTSP